MAEKSDRSEYFNKLAEKDKADYVRKLTLTNGERLPDPFTLETWQDNIMLLPDITWADIYNYLIYYPSCFSRESLKAYKSLEGYNFFVSGHVHNIFYHEVEEKNKFCFFKSEVLPSQRQGLKQKLYKVWVCLNKSEGWILTANCTCMAGLGSVCSHVAALLFKLQACTLSELNKVASTSKLCSWKKSRQLALLMKKTVTAFQSHFLVYLNQERLTLILKASSPIQKKSSHSTREAIPTSIIQIYVQ
eukprot:gene10137-18802_t